MLYHLALHYDVCSPDFGGFFEAFKILRAKCPDWVYSTRVIQVLFTVQARVREMENLAGHNNGTKLLYLPHKALAES